MDVQALTTFHTALSFIAIGFSIPAMQALFRKKPQGQNTSLFLITALATTVTGFFFPFMGVTPAIAVGVVALVILIALWAARYSFQYRGIWRSVYAGTLVASAYLLFFVLIAQAFAKVPTLHALAPTQAEPSFAAAQLILLFIFLAIGIKAVKKFKPA